MLRRRRQAWQVNLEIAVGFTRRTRGTRGGKDLGARNEAHPLGECSSRRNTMRKPIPSQATLMLRVNPIADFRVKDVCRFRRHGRHREVVPNMTADQRRLVGRPCRRPHLPPDLPGASGLPLA